MDRTDFEKKLKKKFDLTGIPPGLFELDADKRFARVFDVEYLHLVLPGGDEIYLTGYGLPCFQNLLPDRFWTDTGWFRRNSKKLRGTSAIYRIKTKEAAKTSLQIVLKWNRMGRDIPAEDLLDEWPAEFNSPFEEFALAIELRNTVREGSGGIPLHKPLAIYVPNEKLELWRLDRKEYIMKKILDKHPGVELSMFRQYAVIYQWIKGVDAAAAGRKGLIEGHEVKSLTLGAESLLNSKGFTIRDRKPHNLILRPKDSGVLRDKNRRPVYALIDFELLQRTEERERIRKRARRQEYLKKQPRRFHPHEEELPENLSRINIMGVDYVYGPVESTGGALWVVGKDPTLFEYFLPERWEHCPRKRLSLFNQIHYTKTKDDINIVWKISRVGEKHCMDPFIEGERRNFEYTFNSPFEEVSLAMELRNKGIPTTNPRAVYMPGYKSELPGDLRMDEVYERHKKWTTPEGSPILRKDRDYFLIFGYWNGPDEMLSVKDGDYYKPINALRAFEKGILQEAQYLRLMKRVRKRLLRAGVKDLFFGGSHIMLSLDHQSRLIRDESGDCEARICNFELLVRTEPGSRYTEAGAGVRRQTVSPGREKGESGR